MAAQYRYQLAKAAQKELADKLSPHKNPWNAAQSYIKQHKEKDVERQIEKRRGKAFASDILGDIMGNVYKTSEANAQRKMNDVLDFGADEEKKLPIEKADMFGEVDFYTPGAD